MKKTAKEKILDFLAMADGPVPIHELRIEGVSQTSASARLREMAREGLVESVPVEGKRYTAWKAVPVVDYDFNTPA